MLDDFTRLLDKAGLERPDTVLEPVEKTMMGGPSDTPASSKTRPTGARGGKPHYTRLLVYEDKLVLAVGCCKSLSIIAAYIDGQRIEGSPMVSCHSDESGGKLLYMFKTKGRRLIIDVKRGNGDRFQRLAFEISNLRSGI